MRWPNLLITGISMYLIRYAIFIPLADNAGISLPLSRVAFSLLVFGVICITAAGYIINDYFDIKTDEINKPQKMILGKFFSKSQGISLYISLNTCGIVAGYFSARATGYPKLVFVFFIAAALLWFYSVSYKRRFLIGNLAIAFLSSLVIGITWLFELFALLNAPMDYTAMISDMFLFNRLSWFFIIFAFIITLIREIIKDAEDIEGDKVSGSNTLPIRLGLKTSARIILVISFLSMLFLLWSQYLLMKHGFTEAAIYYFVIQALIYYTATGAYHALSKEDWKNAGTMAKYTMVAGIAGMELIMLGFK